MPRPKRRATNTTAELASEERVQPSSKRAKKIPKGELNFSQTRLINWFKKYTTSEDPSQLCPDGMERFCEDINLDPKNIAMLIIAYKMGAKEMGYFSQSEWIRGLADPEIQCDSPAKLQNKLGFLYNLMNDPHIFKMIFRYAYDFAKDKDQRSMDIETAKAMLQLLLHKTWPLYSDFADFLCQPKSPRVINKDQWNNIFEFSRTIALDLSNYSIDGAWPVLLDDFVEFLQKKNAFTESS